MSSDRLPVRVFVLTATGEQGPLETPEIASLVVQGVILTSDMVRSASGRNLGTVGELLASAGEDSDGRPAVPSERDSERRRRLAAVPAGRGAGGWLLGAVVIAATIVGLVLAATASRSGPAAAGAAGTAAPADADPEITLTQAAMGDGFTDLRLDAAQELAGTVVVHVALGEDQRTLRMEPADGRVVMRAGSVSAVFRVIVSGDRMGRHQGEVRLRSGSGYRVGRVAPLAVTVERRPPPGIAWEPASYRDQAAMGGGGGTGWSGPWSNDRLVVVAKPLALPGGLPSPPGHLLHAGIDWNLSERRLLRRLTEGVVWMSCIVQGELHKDGLLDWASIALADGQAWKVTIGISKGQDGMLWIMANQPDKADDKLYELPFRRDLLVPTRIVLRIALAPDACALACWFDPPPAEEPHLIDGQHRVKVPPFTLDRVNIGSGKGGIRVADLRLGRTWQEVMPLR